MKWLLKRLSCGCFWRGSGAYPKYEAYEKQPEGNCMKTEAQIREEARAYMHKENPLLCGDADIGFDAGFRASKHIPRQNCGCPVYEHYSHCSDQNPLREEKVREEAARAMCVAEGVDPDKTCFGMGKMHMPEGSIYPAWKLRLAYVSAVIKSLNLNLL